MPQLVMTQSKLKLLTILMNLLVSHLQIIDRKMTNKFAIQINRLIEVSLKDKNMEFNAAVEEIYHEVQSKIPKADDKNWNPQETQNLHIEDKQLNKLLIPFGLNLLLELTFIFIVQCNSEVLPIQLRTHILDEYSKIMKSLVQSDQIFQD